MTTIAAARPQPAPAENPRAVMGDNRPPLEEQILVDFSEALADRPNLLTRIDELVARADAAGPCADADAAGRYADGVKMMRACADAVEEEREKLNRPLLTAQRALKGKADGYTGRLGVAATKLRSHISAWQAEEDRKAEEARRQAEEAARAAQKAALEAAANAGHGAHPEIVVTPAVVETPVARGDYGAKVGTQTEWKHEIISVRQLPDSILKHAKVVEAIDKVIAAQVRGGTRELKGVRIFPQNKTVIR